MVKVKIRRKGIIGQVEQHRDNLKFLFCYITENFDNIKTIEIQEK